MKHWGISPYSRSVHYTESILMVGAPKVKNICAKRVENFIIFMQPLQNLSFFTVDNKFSP